MEHMVPGVTVRILRTYLESQYAHQVIQSLGAGVVRVHGLLAGKLTDKDKEHTAIEFGLKIQEGDETFPLDVPRQLACGLQVGEAVIVTGILIARINKHNDCLELRLRVTAIEREIGSDEVRQIRAQLEKQEHEALRNIEEAKKAQADAEDKLKKSQSQIEAAESARCKAETRANDCANKHRQLIASIEQDKQSTSKQPTFGTTSNQRVPQIVALIFGLLIGFVLASLI